MLAEARDDPRAAAAGDWPLAAQIVVGELAVGQLTEPRGDHTLADEFARMPTAQAWTSPEPFLVAAALAVAEDDRCGAGLRAAEAMLGELPPAEAVPARLAAAQVRLASSRRTGDVESMAAAAAEAGAMLEALPTAVLARCPRITAEVLSGRGAVELWSGRLGEAAATFEAAAAAVPAPDSTHERACCRGYLALADALRGRLNRAASVAAQTSATSASDGER